MIKKNVAVIGFQVSREMEAESILPELVRKTLQCDPEDADLAVVGFDFFYFPAEAWTQARKGRNSVVAALSADPAPKMLAAALEEAQGRDVEVEWTVHGEGSRLIYEALSKIEDKRLDKHYMTFIGPTYDLTKLLPKMRKHDINLFGDVFWYNPLDYQSLTNRVFKHGRIVKKVRDYGPEYEGAAYNLKERMRKERKWRLDTVIMLVCLGLLLYATRFGDETINWGMMAVFGIVIFFMGVLSLANMNNVLKAFYARKLPQYEMNPHFCWKDDFRFPYTDDFRGFFGNWRGIRREYAKLRTRRH
ncbi:hypothetical protein ONV78_13935 [Hahella sp. CR1]|uniref:hypothetical protein n=1 Tax=Hahella sp. CR1 TaxID=2992807 RepID=UPI002442BA40|nr:hypothetical protein [Hahella sp. CR1]MDG9668839.1 hypothetical protein [Hahella sp. CR1]